MRFVDDDALMAPKAHGSSAAPVQKKLRWNVDSQMADRICNFNRESAEYRGYWRGADTRYAQEVSRDEPTVYFDSVSGLPLFVAPIDRSMSEFLGESEKHGWPSFRVPQQSARTRGPVRCMDSSHHRELVMLPCREVHGRESSSCARYATLP